MAERVQFTVSAEDGPKIFQRLTAVEGRGWPKLGSKSAASSRTAWSRAALRTLYAHALRASGTEWFIAKGQKLGQPLIAREPEGTTSFKVDVYLGEADWLRASALHQLKVAESPAAVLRTALHFFAEIGARLAKGGELVSGLPGDARARVVELSRIATDESTTGAEPKLQLRVQGSSTPAAPQREQPPVDSREIDALFGILWVTTAFNRWLATRVDAVTRCALSFAANGQAHARDPEGLRAMRAAGERYERELDLIALLRQFREEQQAQLRGPGPSLLRDELSGHALLPAAFRQRITDPGAQADAAADAIRDYLESRFASLRPWRPRQRRADARAASGTGGEPPAARWRNWTRSRYTADGHREIHAPIEWTAVVHHRLSTQPGGRPALVANDLQTLLLDAFGARNSTHVGLLAESCARYNRAFHAEAGLRVSLDDSDTILRLEEVLRELAPAGALGDPEEEANCARLILLFLITARVVQPVYRWRVDDDAGVSDNPLHYRQVGLFVRSLGYADFSELRARMFGAQVTIPGLHWILRAGIVPRARRGRAWLVFGQPGDGKSTFGLALAADAARRGRVAIVVCSDERAEAVSERLDTFGLRDDARYEVLAREEFERRLASQSAPFAEEPLASEQTAEPQPPRGLLVIFGAATRRTADASADGRADELELASWLERVSERSHALRAAFEEQEKLEASAGRKALWRALQRKWRWIGVVIDSIDTLEVERPHLLSLGGDAREERQAVAKLIQSIESSRVWAILLCGHDHPRRLALSYLADTVVELSTTDSGLERRLQILKCRTQAFDPGLHTLQLVEGSGVVVHPNLPSMQRVARRRNRRHLDGEHVIPLPERVFWPGCQDAAQEDHAGYEPAHRIRRGSTVLLYGAPQSGKGPLLMNLLSQRMELPLPRRWRLGATGAVLFVSFRFSAEHCLRPLAESAALGEKWQNNVSDIQFRWYGADDTLRPSQIAHELVRRIQRSRRDGVPLDWIVFTGVEALKSNLPAVEAERSFWPTILATTASEEITTAFVVAGSEDRFVTQHWQDMDYVFRFGREEASDRRTLLIEKSVEAPPAAGYPTLLIDLTAGTLTPVAPEQRGGSAGAARPSS